MAAKGMALAEFLVKIGFNTNEINKQLNAIEKRLDDILKKRKSVTGKALQDEKALLNIKKQELDIATKQQRLAQAEARTKMTQARAERSITQSRTGYGSRGRGRGNASSRRSSRQDIGERKELLRMQAETMFRGGKINQGQLNAVNSRIGSVTDLKSLGVARGHLAQAAREARRLRSELNLSNVASQRLASSTRQMLGNYVSVFAMAGGAAMGARSSMAVESARAQLFGANFGDQSAANADYDFFRQMSLQYGTGMAESIKSFSGFKYAGGDMMSTDQMRELFKSMTLSGVAGGATQADMDRTFYALKQMASKGKITSEELNLQLAEANPLAKLGIEKAFEEFTGRDRSEMMDMMKRGEVYAKDILPLVAKHLNVISAKGVEAGLKTASKQLDIMTANAVDFASAFGEAGGNEGMAEIFKALTKMMQASAPVIKSVGVAFKYLGQTIAGILNVWSKMVESVAALSEHLTGQGGLLHGIAALAAAVAFKGIPAFKMFAAAIALPLAKALLLFAALEELANWALPDNHPMKKWGVLSTPESTGAWDTAKLTLNDKIAAFMPGALPSADLLKQRYGFDPGGSKPVVNNFNIQKVELPEQKDSEGFANSLVAAAEAAKMGLGF